MFTVKGRLGITPVVSTIILIGATIIAFSYILVFTNQWIKVSRYYDVEGVYEKIVIEDVWFMPLQGNRVVRLAITNVGKIEAKIIMILIFKKDGNILVKSYNPEIDLYVINEAAIINVVLDSPWTSKTVYRIEILTLRGNKFETICTSP